MIRFTRKSNGEPIYIAPENITSICDNNEGGAEVYSGHDFSLVRETAAEVARKVLEWRLSIDDFRDSSRKRLYELAGLEEPGHPKVTSSVLPENLRCRPYQWTMGSLRHYCDVKKYPSMLSWLCWRTRFL